MTDYNEKFYECMVKHERTNNELLFPAVCVAGMVFLIFVLTSLIAVFLPTFTPYLFIVFLFIFFNVARILFARAKLEFEYILTEGEVDIDKIMNRSDRKRVITFRCADIIHMAKIGADREGYENALSSKPKKIIANGPLVSDNTYYVLLPTDKGKTLILFDPDEELALAMKKHNPDHINI